MTKKIAIAATTLALAGGGLNAFHVSPAHAKSSWGVVARSSWGVVTKSSWS